MNTDYFLRRSKRGEGELAEEREHDSSVGDLDGECLIKDCERYTGVDVRDDAGGCEASLVGEVDCGC
jgi:hypothetical protein